MTSVNSIEIDGLNQNTAITVRLFVVDENENISQPVEVEFKEGTDTTSNRKEFVFKSLTQYKVPKAQLFVEIVIVMGVLKIRYATQKCRNKFIHSVKSP